MTLLEIDLLVKRINLISGFSSFSIRTTLTLFEVEVIAWRIVLLWIKWETRFTLLSPLVFFIVATIRPRHKSPRNRTMVSQLTISTLLFDKATLSVFSRRGYTQSLVYTFKGPSVSSRDLGGT